MVQPLSREAQSKLEELGLSEQAYAYVSSQAALLAGQSDGRGEWDDYFNMALSDYRRLVKSFRRRPKQSGYKTIKLQANTQVEL